MSNNRIVVRADMARDKREDWQHYAVEYLDKFLFEAFTAFSLEEIDSARHRLADVQGQCLRHITTVEHMEQSQRIAGADFDVDCTELKAFLSHLGLCLASVYYQLAFSPSIEDQEAYRQQQESGAKKARN